MVSSTLLATIIMMQMKYVPAVENTVRMPTQETLKLGTVQL
jgi:hypothetical protein